MELINFMFKAAGGLCIATAFALYLLLYFAMVGTARKGLGSLNGKLRPSTRRKEKG